MTTNFKTITHKSSWLFGILFLLLFTINSCTDKTAIDNDPEPIGVPHEIDTSDPLYQFITNYLGFDPDHVVDLGNRYVAEGDIAFDKSTYVIPSGVSLAPDRQDDLTGIPMALEDDLTGARVQQRATGILYNVDRSRQRNIWVSIKSNVPQEFRGPIEEAIRRWNSASGCTEISFVLKTGTIIGSIEFRDDEGELSDQTGVWAETDFPSERKSQRVASFGGQPGKYVRLNSNHIFSQLDRWYPDPVERQNVLIGLMVHEMGHAIGFHHTNAFGSSTRGNVHIPETPVDDPQSVMLIGNPAAINLSNFDLSAGDKLALRNFYPKITNTSCTAPLYYYWSSSQQDSFITTQLNHKGQDNFGYNKDPEVLGRVHTSTRPGDVVPLYRYYNQSVGDHMYSTENFSSRNGYQNNGLAFYIHTSAGNGRVELNEYYSSSATNHHYTRGRVNNTGYVFQRTIGYIY